MLACALLSRMAVHVCPSFDSGESKSRQGRKNDSDIFATLKKSKLDTLPVNELPCLEISRRYILAVLSMEGNFDSAEIACRESGKGIHCFQGDGVTLCGSLTGIAALEADAMLLASTMKQIFGSLKSKSETVTTCKEVPDPISASETVEMNDDVIPKWAQMLEPVKKLPTNAGDQIRGCVNEALERNPAGWAKKRLEHSVSKEVYKGNALRKTKRAVVSMLSSGNLQQKPEKKGKVKSATSLSDLIMKQCRVVLRRAAAVDEDRLFCNLLGKTILNPNDKDDEGLLGYPAMVSRPLDFRTIELAAGSYSGSHEAFAGDVQEVLPLVHKIAEFDHANCSTGDAIKERDDFLARVNERSIPRAPWDEGICKVCGMCKDDNDILLCDSCGSEYHRYCLNPPLVRIPEGNWYCPACVAGQSTSRGLANGSTVNQCNKTYHGEFSRQFLEKLARLANLMAIKEYWEFSVEERIFLMKFLFDKALGSSIIHDHIDQCASRTAGLQQKLRSLTSELEILKLEEEMSASNTEKVNISVGICHGNLDSDALASLLGSNSMEKPSERGGHVSPTGGSMQMEYGPLFNGEDDCCKQPCWLPSESIWQKNSTVNSNQINNNPGALSQLQYQPPVREHTQLKYVNLDRQLGRKGASWQNELPMCTQQRKIINRNGLVWGDLQSSGHWSSIDSFVSAETEMPGHSLVDFTGNTEAERAPSEHGISIHKLHGHLCSDQADMIPSQGYSMKLDTPKNDVSHLQGKIASIESELQKVSLRKYFLGRDSNGRAYWFFCWPGTHPCIVSNGSLASKRRSSEEFSDIPDSVTWMSCESHSEIGKLVGRLRQSDVRERELKESIVQWLTSEYKDLNYPENHVLDKGQSSPSIFSNCRKGFSVAFLATKAMTVLQKRFSPCSKMETMNAHKILTPRFVIDNSNKEVVNSIGLRSSGGTPSLLQTESPYLGDPALKLVSTRKNEVSSQETCAGLESHQQQSGNEVATADGMKYSKKTSSSRCAENDSTKGSKIERVKSVFTSSKDKVSSMEDQNPLLGVPKGSIICESSLRPLGGRSSEILRCLKINLLDMDAALPQDALRISRSHLERRCAWRAFVKSAKTIYEMIQATIVLEDTIKSVLEK